MAKSSHSTAHPGDSNSHSTSMNGKAQHVHIPRIFNGVDTTFNTFKGSGGAVECGICGEVLMDNPS